MINNPEDNPLITVFILVYNNESGMRQTVDSVLSQTYENIQVIISDDGSNNYDNETLSIYADELKKKYPDVKLFCNKQNVGTVKHLNNVIKNSDGKYMMPCSSGDMLYDRDTIKKIVSFMEKNHALIASGRHDDVYKDNGVAVKTVKRPASYFGLMMNVFPGFFRKYMFDVKNVLSGSSTCYSRALFDKYGGFDEQYRLVEDYSYYLMLLKNKQKIHWIKDTVTIHEMGGVSNGDVNPFVMKDLEKIKENYRR